MAKPAPNDTGYTYGDYRQWSDETRWELIHGRAFAMTPAPGMSHQTVSRELLLQLGEYFHGKTCQVFHAPFDVRLPHDEESDDEIDTVVQPDLAVICEGEKLDERGCRGAPDWIIEILSPSTAARDQVEKLSLYESHGVQEYWHVHPSDRIVTVYRIDRESSYGRPDIRATEGMQPVALFPGLVIDWDRVTAALPRTAAKEPKPPPSAEG